MLRLIRNDIAANSVSLFGLFLLLNAGLVLIVNGREPLVGGLLFGILMASVAPLPALLRAELSKSIVIYQSLPIRKSDIILSKYGTVYVLIGVTVAYTVFYLSVMHYAGLPLVFRGVAPGLRNALTTEFLIGGITIAIAMPFVIRFGTFMRIIWGIAIIVVAHNLTVVFLKNLMMRGIGVLGVRGLMISVLLFTILINASSIFVSKNILHRRDL